MSLRASALLSISVLLVASPAHSKISPATAGALSVVPGLGQVSSGKPFRGLLWLGLVASCPSKRRGGICQNLR